MVTDISDYNWISGSLGVRSIRALGPVYREHVPSEQDPHYSKLMHSRHIFQIILFAVGMLMESALAAPISNQNNGSPAVTNDKGVFRALSPLEVQLNCVVDVLQARGYSDPQSWIRWK